MRQAVVNELQTIRIFFEGRLAAFSTQRDTPEGIDSQVGANHLLSVLLGVRVLARINPDPRCITDAIGIALNSLGLPPLAFCDIN